jgi:hypothetical protein
MEEDLKARLSRRYLALDIHKHCQLAGSQPGAHSVGAASGSTRDAAVIEPAPPPGGDAYADSEQDAQCLTPAPSGASTGQAHAGEGYGLARSIGEHGALPVGSGFGDQEVPEGPDRSDHQETGEDEPGKTLGWTVDVPDAHGDWERAAENCAQPQVSSQNCQ